MKHLILGLLFISLTSFSSKNQSDVKNYYGIPDVLVFKNIEYKLLTSYHPNNVYYKQEYVPVNETGEHYNSMLIIDFYITDHPIKFLLEKKEGEITERRKNDPIAVFEQFENADLGEYMLDFTMSEGDGKKLTLVEKNVYRYKNYTDKAGDKGILLFALSQRGYGDGLKTFFDSIKENKMTDINAVGMYNIPNIEIAK
jgi:hypothetical protein